MFQFYNKKNEKLGKYFPKYNIYNLPIITKISLPVFQIFHSILQYFNIFHIFNSIMSVFHTEKFTVFHSISQYFAAFYSILQYTHQDMLVEKLPTLRLSLVQADTDPPAARTRSH